MHKNTSPDRRIQFRAMDDGLLRVEDSVEGYIDDGVNGEKERIQRDMLD